MEKSVFRWVTFLSSSVALGSEFVTTSFEETNKMTKFQFKSGVALY